MKFKEARRHAVEQVVASAGSNDMFVRANAMETCERLEPQRALPLLQLGMDDEAMPVLFASLATVGKLRLHAMVPSVKSHLHAESPYVRASALFTLYRCGEQIDLTPLADMLKSTDPSLRGTVAMLLGMTGDRSAVPMLKELARVPLPVTGSTVSALIARIQSAEAIVQLGDESVMSVIRWGLYSNYPEVRVLAATMLGKIGDHKMEEAFFDLLEDNRNPLELRLAVMDSLARMGRSLEIIGEAFESENFVLAAAHSDDTLIRSLAAHTLGTMELARRRGKALIDSMQDPPSHFLVLPRRTSAATSLLTLLEDKSEKVRLSAAAAVLAIPAEAGSLGQ